VARWVPDLSHDKERPSFSNISGINREIHPGQYGYAQDQLFDRVRAFNKHRLSKYCPQAQSWIRLALQ
jgi:hypothetical protein